MNADTRTISAASFSYSPDTLPNGPLRLAVMDCLTGHSHARPGIIPKPDERSLETIIGRLWREDPVEVTRAYDALTFGSLDGGPSRGTSHGLLAERMRELRRPLPQRDRKGKPLKEIADEAGMNR